MTLRATAATTTNTKTTAAMGDLFKDAVIVVYKTQSPEHSAEKYYYPSRGTVFVLVLYQYWYCISNCTVLVMILY